MCLRSLPFFPHLQHTHTSKHTEEGLFFYLCCRPRRGCSRPATSEPATARASARCCTWSSSWRRWLPMRRLLALSLAPLRYSHSRGRWRAWSARAAGVARRLACTCHTRTAAVSRCVCTCARSLPSIICPWVLWVSGGRGSCDTHTLNMHATHVLMNMYSRSHTHTHTHTRTCTQVVCSNKVCAPVRVAGHMCADGVQWQGPVAKGGPASERPCL